MNKTTAKKAAAVLATVAVGVFLFNTVANRISAVDKTRRVITQGV